MISILAALVASPAIGYRSLRPLTARDRLIDPRRRQRAGRRERLRIQQAPVVLAIDIVTEPGKTAITVCDNGPGIAAETVTDILDFSVRVSSREAYVSPTRGAQGNAIKTIIAMRYALDGARGVTPIESHGTRHRITFSCARSPGSSTARSPQL